MKKLTDEYIESLNNRFHTASLHEVLEFVFKTYDKHAILASSLGLEDQLLSHEWLSINAKARIFVLDTGRLNKETYDVIDKMQEKYKFDYEIYHPIQADVNTYVNTKGLNAFYERVDYRKECCHIRKTEPLGRVLKTVSVWITGLRIKQSVTRQEMQLFEYDRAHNILKVNPLIHWDFDAVFSRVKELKIPYNILHNKGYPSIGCEPCTRAIKEGEDKRAGRWWWENPDQKECGIHIVDGKIVRNKSEKNKPDQNKINVKNNQSEVE